MLGDIIDNIKYIILSELVWRETRMHIRYINISFDSYFDHIRHSNRMLLRNDFEYKLMHSYCRCRHRCPCRYLYRGRCRRLRRRPRHHSRCRRRSRYHC